MRIRLQGHFSLVKSPVPHAGTSVVKLSFFPHHGGGVLSLTTLCTK